MKLVALLLTLMLLLGIAPPAEAAFCREVNDHLICIVSIKRSAKYYWEYRASVSVDGEVSPVEIYNCRDRRRLQADGKAVAFEPNGPGNLICDLLNK